MSLLTQAQQEKMLANGREQHKASRSEHCVDFKPVVKLFTPDAQAVWLLSELFPDDPDVAFGLWALGFGLCDLGVGFPELGSVNSKQALNKDIHQLEEASNL